MTVDPALVRVPTLEAVAGAYARGADPRALLEAVLDRIEKADPAIWISQVPADQVAARAAGLAALDADARAKLPLFGVPFAIKDNIDAAGMETTAACPAFAYPAAASAPVVERLVDAGAVLVGKTNMDQFATGLVGVRSPYGVPDNPIDKRLVPGGSSSGSAVAVARGLVSFALGTDTAGSGRVPAALNNIVGLKPTRGWLSARGVVPACQTLDCVSVFALTVGDAWKAAEVAAGFDPAYAWSRSLPMTPPDLPETGFRFGIPAGDDLTFDGDAHGPADFEAAITRLEALGGTAVAFDFAPFRDCAQLLYNDAFVAERLQATGRVTAEQPDEALAVIRQIIGGAARYSGVETFDAIYRLQGLRRRAEAVWQDVDVMLLPTMPRAVTREEVAADPIGPNARNGTYTNFVNFMDLAALALPSALDGARPFGVTLVGPAFSDRSLARLGQRFHAATGLTLGATYAGSAEGEAALPAGPPTTLDLLVIGAHMAGLPLNHQLTDLGGSLVAAVETAPGYRLYDLGGAPARPGMVRVEEEGAAIKGEVWRLPIESVGRFLAGIPAPLGIGTVTLADGTTVKGFLCEGHALGAATDITPHGGWRAWIARRS